MFRRRKNDEAIERLERVYATGRAETAQEAEWLAVLDATKAAPIPGFVTDVAIYEAVERQIEAEKQHALGLTVDHTGPHVHNSAVEVTSTAGNVHGNLYDAVEPISAERAKAASEALMRVIDKLRARTT